MLGKGWLEPLLGRIKVDMNHVVTPVMDIIDDQTFEFKSFDAKSINIGGFDWNLQFVWIGIPEHVKNMQKSDIDFIKFVKLCCLIKQNKFYFSFEIDSTYQFLIS